MGEIELLERSILAVALGLLIGIERGWQQRKARDGGRTAGIRTYTLIGALGALAGLLSGKETIMLGFCFLAFALPFAWFEWKEAQQSHTVSATGLIAGLLTFALGAYAVRGNMLVAAAFGVTLAAVLAERRLMHSFLRHLKWTELRAALVLLAMTAVLLPALPDRTIDPWNAINPHQIWMMTVLVGLVSYGGYIAIRLAGPRKGLLFAALMGGVVSSTTVTCTFARMARREHGTAQAVVMAILCAWIVSLLRMGLLAVAIQPSLFRSVAPPLIAAAATLALPAALFFRAAKTAEHNALTLEDPLDLPLMLRLTALLAAIMLLSKIFSAGSAELYALGGLSGLLDVDPITLSMAKLAGSTVPVKMAVATILIAAAANGLGKTVMAMIFGGPRLGSILGLSAMAALGAASWIYMLA